jgi:hypothetical protein
LHVYRDEAHRLRAPQEPLESFEVARVFASPEDGVRFQQTFRCADRKTARPVAVFRSGGCDLWEEITSARLWVDLLNTAARIACNPSAPPTTSRLSGRLWHEAISGA